jgi:hypothetical protein
MVGLGWVPPWWRRLVRLSAPLGRSSDHESAFAFAFAGENHIFASVDHHDLLFSSPQGSPGDLPLPSREALGTLRDRLIVRLDLPQGGPRAGVSIRLDPELGCIPS